MEDLLDVLSLSLADPVVDEVKQMPKKKAVECQLEPDLCGMCGTALNLNPKLWGENCSACDKLIKEEDERRARESIEASRVHDVVSSK